MTIFDNEVLDDALEYKWGVLECREYVRTDCGLADVVQIG